MALRQACLFQHWRHRHHTSNVGVLLAIVASLLDHRDHGPSTEDVLQFKAAQFVRGELLATPCLQVLAQSRLVGQRERVVLADGHWLVLACDGGVAMSVFAVHLKLDHHFGQELDLALKFSFLCAHVDDAVAPSQVAPIWYWGKATAVAAFFRY